MRLRRFILIIIFLIFSVFAVIFAVKLRKKSSVEEQKVIQSDNYDFLIYNTEPKFQDCFDQLATIYKDISGIVPCFECVDRSKMYCNFEAKVPDVMMIRDLSELNMQIQYGNVFDFLNASEKTFQEVIKNIPNVLRYQTSNISNCGIPLTVRGFGLAVNQKLLASIFGEEHYKNVTNDLISCSYEDFSNFVKGVKSSSVCLNGNTYLVNQSSASKLNSIFSFHAETSIPKLLNNVFAYSFDSLLNLSATNNISNMHGEFSKWLKMVELMSSNSFISRGKNFVDQEKNSRLNSIKNFASEKSLFLIAEDSDFDDIKLQNPDIVSSLEFIPFKMPFDYNKKNANNCLTIYCPYYLIMNPKSTKIKMTQDFLTWLISSPASLRLLREIGCIPPTVKDREGIENTLSSSVLSAIDYERYIPPFFSVLNTRTTWISPVTKQVKKYLSIGNWNSSYYSSFDDYCVKKWMQ